MEAGSIWQKDIEKPSFPPLEGESSTDVLVIGGGMTGILCGYMLQNAGVDCVIAEANVICGGTTGHTTAKLTWHHGAIFDGMIRRYGVEGTRLYLDANRAALEKYRTLAQGLDCELEEVPSYVYSRKDRRKLEKEVTALNRAGYAAGLADALPLPFRVAGAVVVPGQAQLHPLKFAYALARELKLFEHTPVTALLPDGAVTPHGHIRAKKIIVATHFPFPGRRGLYFLKLYQHRSYVLALQNAPHMGGIYVDEDERGLSFRSYGDLLLLGGGGHRTGKRGGGWRELSAFAEAHFPGACEVARFAAEDCMPLDDIPYIGHYTKNTTDLYTATGFHKWGMTSAMVAAELLRDLILGHKNPYASLFSPSRGLLHKQLLANAGESLLGLLTPTRPRCTHLGCALRYNPQEHTWDCPCHGSRYTEEGHVLENPATKNLKNP